MVREHERRAFCKAHVPEYCYARLSCHGTFVACVSVSLPRLGEIQINRRCYASRPSRPFVSASVNHLRRLFITAFAGPVACRSAVPVFFRVLLLPIARGGFVCFFSSIARRATHGAFTPSDVTNYPNGMEFHTTSLLTSPLRLAYAQQVFFFCVADCCS